MLWSSSCCESSFCGTCLMVMSLDPLSWTFSPDFHLKVVIGNLLVEHTELEQVQIQDRNLDLMVTQNLLLCTEGYNKRWQLVSLCSIASSSSEHLKKNLIVLHLL